jgi:hypothetical protein
MCKLFISQRKAANCLAVIFALLTILSQSMAVNIYGACFAILSIGAFLNRRFIFTVIEYLSIFVSISAPFAILNPFVLGDLVHGKAGWWQDNPILLLVLCFIVVEIISLSVFYLSRCAKKEKEDKKNLKVGLE